MILFEGREKIGKLEPRKGGYAYLVVQSKIVEQFEKKAKTRLICRLPNEVEFQCGLNHLGDGNFFLILSMKNMERAGIAPGDQVAFKLLLDPNPLGVEIPEVLNVLLSQDEELNRLFEELSDGKKRGIIHQIIRIKDIDKQIHRAIALIKDPKAPKRN